MNDYLDDLQETDIMDDLPTELHGIDSIGNPTESCERYELDCECPSCDGDGCVECYLTRRAMREWEREEQQEQLLERMESD